MTSRKLKIIINVVTIAALLVVTYLSWPQIQSGIKEIQSAKILIVLLMIPVQLINYLAVAKLYQSYFKESGVVLPTKLMYKIALELNFVNHVFPSGGVAGFSYLGIRLRHQGIRVAKTTLAQAMRFALTFLSFLIVLFFGMFMLSLSTGRGTGGVALFIGLSIAFLTLFGTIVAIFIVSRETRIKAFTAALPRLANFIIGRFSNKKTVINIERIEKLFSDLHKDYLIITRDWRKLKVPFLWALVINITEVGTAYLAYVALGQLVNPGAVILAYSVAGFAGLISIFPGGIGIYEALMTGVLASAGVPKALALSATLIFRITCMIAFLPPGFILYQMALKRGEVEPVTRETTSLGSNSD